MTEYIGLIFTAIGLAATTYFSTRSLRQSIKAQEEQRKEDLSKRQNELIEKAERDTERHTQIIERLNTLMRNTDENKREISNLKDEVKRLNDTQIANVQNVEVAFNRIEAMERRVELLHKEHRENMARCCHDE